MRITIGEIVDKVMPYSNSIDVTMHHGVPFMRARISTVSNYTVCFMYVIQTADHKYAVADCHDDVAGDRFLPWGTTSQPFVIEQDVIRSLFGIKSGDDISYKYDTVITDLNLEGFSKHLLERLHHYGVIRLSGKDLQTKISDMGFTSIRIKRSIDDEFRRHKKHLGVVEDLIDIVEISGKPFSLTNLKTKEISVVSNKLREIGITLIISDDNCITSLKFDKRKGAFS